MRKLLALVLVFTISLQSEAKTFNRCGLVHELRNQGFPESKLADWVCLVEHESSGRTHITNTNRNGSKDYGLFQINDRYWCSSSGGAGKDCRVACSDLITDDITKAARCAKKVYARHGFKAWYGWKNNCKGSLPDISSC